MSETVVNQPLSEKVKEPHRSLAIDASSTDTSANFTSDIKSDLALSPGENHFTNSTDDCEEYTPEEMRQLDLASQKLTNEVVEKPEYKKELDEMRQTIQKAFSSTLPLNMKMKMMESAMEGLKTKINCIKDNNKSFKAKIIEIRKMSTGKTETEAGKNTETKETPAEAEDSTMNESKKLEEKQEDSEPAENKKPESESEAKNEAKITEIKKLIDQLKGQNEKWEETIALLKQQRNILLVTMEDRRDEIDDMQYLIKEKKTNLDKKVLYTEELRQKISKDSSNKPPTKSGGATHRKTISDAGGFTVRNHIPAAIGEKITDISTSVFNTSVFQDVSSKLTQVFGSVGRALGMTREDVNPDQILTADFLKEINQPPAPRGITSKDNARSTSQTPSKGQTKGHTRTMSTNLRPSKKV